MKSTPRILVVDDENQNLRLMEAMLIPLGYEVFLARDGMEALESVRETPPDVILLDVMMPKMDGFEVTRRLKEDEETKIIPIVMVTALKGVEDRVRALEAGANDFLTKPVDKTELRARVSSLVQVKAYYDYMRKYQEELSRSNAETNRLLLNILPQPIADRLKNGEEIIADRYSEVTILFADIVGFTSLAASMTPAELLEQLNHVFSVFDRLTEEYGLEKIKTIGDKYMVVGGLPVRSANHAGKIAEMALGIQKAMPEINEHFKEPLNFRIGMHTGSVVAGVIGKKKFAYDIWGDAVNIASRMESTGIPGKIQTSEPTYQLLNGRFQFEERGMIEIKGKGILKTYFLKGKKPQ